MRLTGLYRRLADMGSSSNEETEGRAAEADLIKDSSGDRKEPKAPRGDHPQPQSSFFAKLPPEIRIQIYSLALPAEPETVDVVIPFDRFHRLQHPPTPGQRVDRHVLRAHRRSGQLWLMPWVRGKRTSSVLLVCWRMYKEAADILYSNRSFSFESLGDFVQFHRAASVTAFSRITSLSIFCCRPHAQMPESEFGTHAHDQATNILLSEMPHLRRLQILTAALCWRKVLFELTSLEEFQDSEDFYSKKIQKELSGSFEWLRRVPCKGNISVQFFYPCETVAGESRVRKMYELQLEDGDFVISKYEKRDISGLMWT
ncbi:hypothetical protein BCR34DRAFT_221310 [Clohesyomyces aquaticus]|uniref:DUF7730 domain-containing protein n=1 Tax=Clohesyomyces aquaticus TaxID=1231657 RepID=A0A1Y1Y8W6_9PLEO|nr:hypothetical protein BCR34DRAFT_221310 [Clohesyomyces aquaticus]